MRTESIGCAEVSGGRLMFKSYFSAQNLPPARVVFIVGAHRSGKTLIGNLLGSCERVEHIDEPWSLIQTVILAGHKLLDESVARDLFLTQLYEIINDRILMRHVNFREIDLSLIFIIFFTFSNCLFQTCIILNFLNISRTK